MQMIYAVGDYLLDQEGSILVPTATTSTSSRSNNQGFRVMLCLASIQEDYEMAPRIQHIL